jgi:spermidine synthase
MKKFERLGATTAPDGTVLVLYRHDGAYSLRAHNVELMSTRRHFSEEKLAELTCAPLRDQRRARVLIGGLGFGFTLRAALRSLARDATVVVAELLDAVIEWNRNPEYALAGDALADPRVELRHADVMTVLRRGRGQFDAIMLDVDNGAESFTTAGNGDLYRDAGVHMAAEALAPQGRLAYWSAGDEPAFERTLRDAGLSVETVRVRAHPTSGVTNTLYIGQHSAARKRD